jgi:hypothetical protein
VRWRGIALALVTGSAVMGVTVMIGASVTGTLPAPQPRAPALRPAAPHLGALSLRAGCRPGNPDGTFVDPSTGLTDFAKVPRWVPVSNTRWPGGFPGCIPRELLFPELDGGVAVADLRDRAGGAYSRPPLPIFSPTGGLVAWMVASIGPVTPSQARRAFVSRQLLAHAPTAAHYEQHPA